MKKIITYSVIGAFALSGCATTGTKTATEDAQDCAMVAGGAALVCGLVSGKVGPAAACALAAGAACYLYKSYQSKQVRTAQQVNDEYKKANNGKLAPEPTVVSYKADLNGATLNKSASTRKDGTVVMKSYVVVAEGSQNKEVKLEEQLQLIDKDKNDWAGGKKKAFAQSAGDFENSFTFSPEKIKMDQGSYTIKRKLFLNNKMVAERPEQKLQVVKLEDGRVYAFVMENPALVQIEKVASN